MTNEKRMPPKYDPHLVEVEKYEWGQEKHFFQAETSSNKPSFSIVLPPPNVTGILHIGHAWDGTLQDIIIRIKRMQGYNTLYLPGMDHAGIATQAKIEAKLKEQSISRYDLGREKFVDRVWEWKEEYAKEIRKQWGKLGLSLDYTRERFTLDAGLSEAVNKVFVSLYQKGLIYRGERIINWDPIAKTALSDIEVIHKEVEGSFYHLKYPFTDGSGYLEVATTRPETIPGDMAVAVHPEDPRYKSFTGKMISLPMMNRAIPVIADHYVDKDFGSGAVKITPAHDPNDFEVGNRHQLPRLIIMDEEGKMNADSGKYKGLDRLEARQQIIADFRQMGLFIKEERHVHSVGHSERTGAVVEPYLSKQWFVKMEPLAKEALELQQHEDKINFVPERFENIYTKWMTNIHDWCISRQLWWGHRIPAWYHKNTNEIYVGTKPPVDSENWTQEEDVLDTWFSSALWPFSTLGWPDVKNDDYHHFFPTSVLVTGYDIIFFWVARMIFQSIEFTGQKPFADTLFHGLVRDSEGRKMSKSLGNGVDPNDIIEKYGADSLRYMLATGASPGQDLKFHIEKIEAAWNFINKIWNASRFVLMNLDDMSVTEIDLTNLTDVSDKWILTRLNETIRSVTDLIENYEFGEVGRLLYNFIWDDFCDWYIEMAKMRLYGKDEKAKRTTQSVLAHALNQIMRLLHPFMPFVTEEIWQNIPHEQESVAIASWPVVIEAQMDPQAAEEMKVLVAVIRAIRNIRAEVNTPLSKPVVIQLKPANEYYEHMLVNNITYIEKFCNPESLAISLNFKADTTAMTAVLTGVEIYLPLAGLIDITAEKERLKKELAKWEQEVVRVQSKLKNERFMAKAPEKIIAEEKAKEADYLEKQAKIKERLQTLQTIDG